MSVIIKATDMSEEMQLYALDCLTRAMERYNIEKDIAAYIKKEFDKKYYPSWHCVVGRNFGSYVTHATRHFIYFSKGQVYILLFKSAIDQECSLHKLALSTALPIVNSLILLFTIFVVKWTIKGS